MSSVSEEQTGGNERAGESSWMVDASQERQRVGYRQDAPGGYGLSRVSLSFDEATFLGSWLLSDPPSDGNDQISTKQHHTLSMTAELATSVDNDRDMPHDRDDDISDIPSINIHPEKVSSEPTESDIDDFHSEDNLDNKIGRWVTLDYHPYQNLSEQAFRDDIRSPNDIDHETVDNSLPLTRSNVKRWLTKPPYQIFAEHKDEEHDTGMTDKSSQTSHDPKSGPQTEGTRDASMEPEYVPVWYIHVLTKNYYPTKEECSNRLLPKQTSDIYRWLDTIDDPEVWGPGVCVEKNIHRYLAERTLRQLNGQ